MTAITIILILLSISIHELGHAIAMQKYGVYIDEICLLGFGPKLLSFNIKYFGDTPLTIRLFPIGAFVRPSDAEQVKGLTYKQSGHIDGAGICNNFIFSALLLSICLIHQFNYKDAIIGGICLLLGLFPKFTFRLILPIGVAVGGLIISYLIKDPLKFVQDSGSIVAITQDAIKYSTTIFTSLSFAALVSFSIALFNCLPFYPLDGGQILSKTLKTLMPNKINIEKYVRIVSFIPFAILILLSVGNDIFKLIKGIIF